MTVGKRMCETNSSSSVDSKETLKTSLCFIVTSVEKKQAKWFLHFLHYNQSDPF